MNIVLIPGQRTKVNLLITTTFLRNKTENIFWIVFSLLALFGVMRSAFAEMFKVCLNYSKVYFNFNFISGHLLCLEFRHLSNDKLFSSFSVFAFCDIFENSSTYRL